MVKIQMGREKKRAHHTKNKRLGLPFQVISLESIMSLVGNLNRSLSRPNLPTPTVDSLLEHLDPLMDLFFSYNT